MHVAVRLLRNVIGAGVGVSGLFAVEAAVVVVVAHVELSEIGVQVLPNHHLVIPTVGRVDLLPLLGSALLLRVAVPVRQVDLHFQFNFTFYYNLNY